MREVDNVERPSPGQGGAQTSVADDRAVAAVRGRFDERLFAFDMEIVFAHELRFHGEPRRDIDLRGGVKFQYRIADGVRRELLMDHERLLPGEQG